MKRLNVLFSLSSLTVFLVTLERFSFTTKILFQPYNFIRLHELVQMNGLILFTVLIHLLILKEVTHNFKTIQQKSGFLLFILSLIGVYFYATGNGVHELASFTVNTFCDVQKLQGDLCHGLYINDYYTGNILFFIGGIFMSVSLILFEKKSPSHTFEKKDQTVLWINALIFSLAIIAYAAFDQVIVGLIYSILMTLITVYFFVPIRKKYLHYPLTTYTTLTYVIGTVIAIAIRFLR